MMAGRTKKLLLPATYIMAFLQGCYIVTYQYLLLNMAEELGLSTSQMGMLAGIMFGAQILLPLAFGVLSDRGAGKKIFVIIAASMLLLAQILYVWASTFQVLLVLAFLGGSGFGAIQSLSLGVFSDNYSREEAVKHTNLSQTILSIGGFIAPFVVEWLLGRGLAWRQLFLPIAIALGVTIVLYSLVRIEKPRARRAVDTGIKPNHSLAIKKHQILKSPLLYILMIWGVMWSGAEASTTSYMDAYVTVDMGMGEISAIAMSLFWLMQVPSRALMGYVKKGYLNIIVVFIAAFAINSVILVITQNPVVVLVCCALFGFLSGPIWPAMFLTGQQAFPNDTGFAGSLCGAFSGVGSFLATTIGGAVSEKYTFGSIYIIVAGLALVALGFALCARRMVNRNRAAAALNSYQPCCESADGDG